MMRIYLFLDWKVNGEATRFDALTELTALMLLKMYYRTKISSFDAYLKRANELGQRLLIEIKTSKKDFRLDMMDRFRINMGKSISLKQYGQPKCIHWIIKSSIK